MARPADTIARRQTILDAGAAALRDGGLAGLQMRDVAGRAGLATGTLYTYFATKEALLAALYARRLDEMLEAFDRLAAESADPRELFVLFATQYRDMYAEFGREVDLAAPAGNESRLDSTTLDHVVRSTSRMTAAMLSMLSRFNVPQPEVALPVLWALLSGLAAHFAGPRSGFHEITWTQAMDFTFDRLLKPLISSEDIS